MSKDIISEEEFLNCIYKNADMGLIGIKSVIKEVNNDELKHTLIEEYKDYEKIKNTAKKYLKENDYEIKSISNAAKISSTVMVDMALKNDNSCEKIAKMMLEGTNKGIIELLQKMNAYNKENKKAVALAKRFRNILEKNVVDLKKYL